MPNTLNPNSNGIKKYVFLILSILYFNSSSLAQPTIVAENQLAGNPITEWGVSSSADFRNVNLNGYTTDISVNRGSTVHFKIDDHDGGSYTLKIYRLGYYGGMGASLKMDLGSLPAVFQPAGVSDPTTGLMDCSNWSESAHWDVPSTAVSGYYVAKIQSTTVPTDINNIVFIVRNDASTSDIFFQANDATWQAYNGYGGNNVYNGTTSFPSGHAVKVSYNRPFFIYNTGFLTNGLGADWYMNDSYPMIRWMERNGYDVSYTTNMDVLRSGSLIKNHKIFVTNGHDEYWSKEQRDAVEAARASGVNMAFFTGNEVYWKTRYEADVNGTPNRVMVCYKEGLLADGTQGEATCGTKCDPNPTVWTGLWRMGAAFDAPLPENALTGQISWDGTAGTIVVPDTYKNLRFWKNTSVATLGSGAMATLAANTLGYEWDYNQFPSTYPHGRILLSSTQLDGHTHNLSLYRFGGTGGPLIFGAGTVQWAWGLDDQHFGTATPVSQDMQQATVNLFADMGAQPGTLQSNLIAATKSTDVLPPASVITSPTNGSVVTINTTVTISGTATDAGGGAVGGVEVSIDGGTTWQVASGTNNWTFSWTPLTPGVYTIKSRSFDDSGNMEADPGSTGANVITITLGSAVCPCHIFTTQTPVATTGNDNATSGFTGIELGLKFQSSESGFITGIRFYKTTGNTGTHIGELYTSGGTRLAQATFTGETATGWQTVSFSAPVAITPNTTYVASYFSSAGNYVEDNAYFSANPVINSPLVALAEGTDGSNAPFQYSNSPTFPSQFFESANYWVDVTFNYTAASSPVANAGTNQTIMLPASSVTLNGNGSSGTITDYTWTMVSGPNTPTITTPNAVSTTVTGLIQGSYIFQLSLNSGASTSKVTITVNPASSPVANAGTNQTIMLPASSVTLNGSGSSGTITDYTWTMVSGPNTPTITTPNAVSTTVTGLIQGTYVFQLSVNSGASTSQTTVNIIPAGSATTIFTTQTPSGPAGNDGQTIELGVKFRSSIAGTIAGVRFYKTTGNTGTHIGELYSSTGTRLAQATFTNETASGWQTVIFTTPVAIAANTTYVAAYFSGSGNYIGTANYFTTAVVNSPLTALANGTDGSNGVYQYTTAPAFPNQTYHAANYWVDVVLTAGTTPVANAGTNQTITLPASSVTLNGSGSSGTITDYTWTMVSGPNTPTITTPNAVSTTVTGLIQGNYIFQLSLNSGASTSKVTITVNPAPPPVANAGTNQTIMLPASSVTLNGNGSSGTITDYTWTMVSGPNTPTITTPNAVSTTVTGLIQGSYIFQLSLNSGASTSKVTITVNPASSPVANAGTNQTIMLPASSVTLNGSGSSGTITDYTWTMVSGPNTPTITTPNAVSTTVTGLIQGSYIFQLSLNSGASTSKVTITVNPASSPVANAGTNQTIMLPASSVTLNGSGSSGTITDYTWTMVSGPNTPTITTPNAVSTTVTGLIQGTYVFQLSVNSGASTSQTTVNIIPAGSATTIFTTQTPSGPAGNDGQTIELGVKFRSSIAGTITGVRFYKTTGNTGTHIGELYSSTGTRLAQATFTNETASGWQTVIFTTPVAIAANTTYVAAYFSGSGNYIGTANYFTTAVVNSPLTALANGTDGSNGVYQYTTAPAFPNQTYHAANYWVDVVFSTLTQTQAITRNQGTITIDTAGSNVEFAYSLGQNYPNPVYQGITRINYSIPISAAVALVLYDMQGRQIRIMVNETKSAGSYSYDLNTSILAKGVYFYRMVSGNFQSLKKMVVQ